MSNFIGTCSIHIIYADYCIVTYFFLFFCLCQCCILYRILCLLSRGLLIGLDADTCHIADGCLAELPVIPVGTYKNTTVCLDCLSGCIFQLLVRSFSLTKQGFDIIPKRTEGTLVYCLLSDLCISCGYGTGYLIFIFK